jgi:prophage antirepressor-like protein
MNALSTFTYLSNTVRVVEIDGQPWFVAMEPCDILGLGNASMACRILRDDEKQVVTRSTNINLFELGRGSSRLILISESGLYKLIMRSDKPEARKFQDWVTREVLPAIRKDGGYILGEEKVNSGEMDGLIS